MSVSRLGIQKVYIEVTNYCNFCCKFCPLGISRRPRQHLDYQLFTQVIDDISGHQIADTVAFHVLGEPLLYPRIVDAVRYANDHGLRTSITTNGSLLTEGRIGPLLEAGLHRLTISLQRFGQADHEARRAPMEFDDYYRQLLNAIRYINLFGCQTQVYVLVMNGVTRRLFDSDQLANFSWDRHRFRESLVDVIRDVHLASVGAEPDEGQIVESVRSLGTFEVVHFRLNNQTSVAVRPFFDWGNAFNGHQVIPARYGFCGLAFTGLGILSNGQVTPCCGDYDGEAAFGNLAETRLPEILSGPRTQEFAKAMNHYRLIDSKCRNCFGSINIPKTALKALFFSLMFKIVRPGPGKRIKEIYPLKASG
jgi:radical SAM protein with 4Fe4S-binding SPASM domain